MNYQTTIIITLQFDNIVQKLDKCFRAHSSANNLKIDHDRIKFVWPDNLVDFFGTYKI